MKAVLDTNILVSALMTCGGTCDQVARLVVDGVVRPCVDRRVLDEYERVLPLPLFRIPPDEVRSMLNLLRAAAEVVFPPSLAVTLPHPNDLPFLEVAAEADAILITGNLRHFPESARAGVTVLSPKEFLDHLRGRL